MSLNWKPTGCAEGPAAGITGMCGIQACFPADLLSRTELLDLGPEDLYLAWEVARLAGLQSGPLRERALVMLLLAARLATTEGSTRLPLQKSGLFRRLLNDLATDADEQTAVLELLDDARKASSEQGDGFGLAAVFGGPGDYCPLIFDHGSLYVQKMYVLEQRVGQALRRRVEEGAPSHATGAAAAAGSGRGAVLEGVFEKAFRDVLARPTSGPGHCGPIELNEEQKEAVRRAFDGRLAVISGRPGSGKTSVVASILRVAVRIGAAAPGSIALAAPTGKAADRLRSSINGHLGGINAPGDGDRRLSRSNLSSVTLHRLLGYSPGRDRFLQDERNPLTEKMVIVDESSMIDLSMFDRLLRALRPETHLVLIGDADQLPSIEAGAVLRDLCRAKSGVVSKRVVVLRESYRAREEDPCGRAILDAAEAINGGRLPPVENAANDTNRKSALKAGALVFEGVELLQLDDEHARSDFYDRWLAQIVETEPTLAGRLSRTYRAGPGGFDTKTVEEIRILHDYYERFRMLCVTRAAAGGAGVEGANIWFSRRWADWSRAENIPFSGTPYLVGEPVMVTRNDYNLGLFNGDSGLVLMVGSSTPTRSLPPEPMALFPRGGGFAAYPPAALQGRLDRAWSITVHKAQGSEYDHVAVVLPDRDVRMLTRELLYTALTRARRSVVVAGSLEILERGVARAIERASGLPDFLDLPGERKPLNNNLKHRGK